MQIYSPQGEELYLMKAYEYTGNFMDESTINATIHSPTKIDFKAGTYVIFRNALFSIHYPKPVGTKTASGGVGIGDAFKYDLTFYSKQRKLTEIGFYDYVPGYDDSEVYYTGSPEVSFFGNINSLAGRVEANLKRYYTDQGLENPWQVIVDPDFLAQVESGDVILEEKTLSTSNGTCWDAVQMANDQLSVDFFMDGYTITFGGEGITLPFSLEYGKDKGLRSLQLSYDDSNKLITRLKVIGSSENLPNGYRSDDFGVASNLRIPESLGVDYIDIDWSYDPSDPNTFVWRLIKEEYGIIEGSAEPYDIKPSIEGATDSLGRPLDQIVSGSSPTIAEDAGSFTVTVYDPGFDPLNITPDGDTARISMKASSASGAVPKLAGYEFSIVSVIRSSGNMQLTLARNTEEPTYLPSEYITLDEGDNFVYLGIAMPEDPYITQAEQNLLEKGQFEIQDTNGIAVQYTAEPSNLFLSKNPDIADALEGGNRLPVIDADMGLDGQPITIQSIRIVYGGEVPIYSLTLANIKYKTLRDSIRVAGQNQSNYNKLIRNDLRSTTNITNVIGGETPTWVIRE